MLIGDAYVLPSELSTITTATIAETTSGDVMLCHDQNYLYASNMNKDKGPKSLTFQKFKLPGIDKLDPILKGYFMTMLGDGKVTIFQVSLSEHEKVILKYIYNLNRQIQGRFLREVGCGMAQLHLTCQGNTVLIYQFTAKGKTGHMSYQINDLNTITHIQRKQLYGSKTIINTQHNVVYSLQNYTSKVVADAAIYGQEKNNKFTTLAFLGLPKSEDIWALQSNFTVTNVSDRNNWHRIFCEHHSEQILRIAKMKDEERAISIKVRTFFDHLLVQDQSKHMTFIFHIKPKGSCLIGVEYGPFEWFWACQKKLIGVEYYRRAFRIVNVFSMNPDSRKYFERMTATVVHPDLGLKMSAMPPPLSPLPPPNSERLTPANTQNNHPSPKAVKYQEKHSHSLQIPRNQAGNGQKQLGTQPAATKVFKPSKIIQKKQVNYSKTLNKPKQVAPIPEEKKNLPKFTSKPQSGQKQKQESEDQIPVAEKEDPPGVAQPQKEESLAEGKQEAAKAELQDLSKKESEEENEWLITETFKGQAEAIDRSQVLVADESKAPASGEISPPTDEENTTKTYQENRGDEGLKKGQDQVDTWINFASIMNQGGLMTRLNRNHIFNSTSYPANENTNLLKTRSQSNYYNPFLTHGLLPKPIEPPLFPPIVAIKPEVKKQEQEGAKKGQQKCEQEEFNEIKQQIEKDQNRQEGEGEGEIGRGLSSEVKELFQKTTHRLVRVLEEMTILNQNEPTIKNKTILELQTKVKQSLQKTVSGEFTNRLERYFQEVLRQVGMAQQEAIKFAKQAKAYRQGSIEAQLSNQEKLVMEIREIQNMMRLGVLAIQKDNQRLFESLIGLWNDHMKQTNSSIVRLEQMRDHWQIQTQRRIKRHQETQSTLQDIKSLLMERLTAQQQTAQKRMERQSRRLKKGEREKKGPKKGRKKEKGDRSVSAIRKSTRV